MLTISIKHGERYYSARVSQSWAMRHDNGALISCGLTVGESLTDRAFKLAQKRFRVTEVSREAYNHSGCQSYCTLRGDVSCRW